MIQNFIIAHLKPMRPWNAASEQWSCMVYHRIGLFSTDNTICKCSHLYMQIYLLCSVSSLTNYRGY